MSTMSWIIVAVAGCVFFGWLIWEAYNAPIMPDDYGIEEDDIDNKWIKNK